MATNKKIPVIDYTKCIKCDTCMNVCHTKTIRKEADYTCVRCVQYCRTMQVPCNPNHYVFCYEDCDSCGECVTSCPENAMYWMDIVLN